MNLRANTIRALALLALSPISIVLSSCSSNKVSQPDYGAAAERSKELSSVSDDRAQEANEDTELLILALSSNDDNKASSDAGRQLISAARTSAEKRKRVILEASRIR